MYVTAYCVFFAFWGAAYISKNFGWKGVYFSCIISCIIAMGFIATTWKKESASVEPEKKQGKTAA